MDTMRDAGAAAIDGGAAFWGGAVKGGSNGGGLWAGLRLLDAIRTGGAAGFSPEALRTLDVLQKDEWVHLDSVIVRAATERLQIVGDLLAAGLSITVPNGMAKTVFEYEKVSDMNPADVSLDGIARTEADRQEFGLHNMPMPVTHKDWFMNLRQLMASRERGTPLETSQAEVSGRKVAEACEGMTCNGGRQFGGSVIHGLTTHPDRNTLNFGTNGNWVNGAKTGENIVDDVLSLVKALEGDRFWGPYWLYYSRNSATPLERDFKAGSDKTIRQRILEIDGIQQARSLNLLPDNQIILLQPTSDVIAMVTGESLQTVMWDVQGGFRINFKAFQIMVPLLRSDYDGRMGLAHMRTP